jgi:Ran GTPase-activating protein (RanGAP) involved in mRNA processing and transport
MPLTAEVLESVRNGTCRRLTSSRDQLTYADVEALTDALKYSNCKLTSLDLSWNGLTDAGARVLAEALMHPNCKLTSLHFAYDKLTDAGARVLAEALMHPNCKLISLNFAYIAGGCHITRETEKAIGQAKFELLKIERQSMRGVPAIVRPSIRGMAIKNEENR